MSAKVQEIEKLIYEVNEQWIMLDTDIAKFYGYETRRLNEQVKRNENLFTEAEVFKLEKMQFDNLMSQICDIKGEENTHGGRRHVPYAFTKQGVKILGIILNSDDSRNTTKHLLDAFENKEASCSIVTKNMMNTEDIRNLIYTIRGEQVMLNYDLAKIYGYEVKRLNEQVKNNIERFPSDFMFQLTFDEIPSRSKFSTLNGQGKNIKYAPYAFTEQGIYMISTVLNGELAIRQSIAIMRAFKEMRHFFSENKQLLDSNIITNLSFEIGKLHATNQEQNILLEKHEIGLHTANSSIHELNKQMESLMNNFIDDSKKKEWIFVDGQKFEADEAYICIYQQAKHSIFVVDDYVSIKTLTHLKHKHSNVQVILFSDNKASKEKLTAIEVSDFNSQYPLLCLYPSHNLIHDRLIVLDFETENETIYHCGASSKDAGNKFCTILKVYEPSAYHEIIKKLMNT